MGLHHYMGTRLQAFFQLATAQPKTHQQEKHKLYGQHTFMEYKQSFAYHGDIYMRNHMNVNYVQIVFLSLVYLYISLE